jgi:glycosyltransferase involved in cell wall biosynthesis
VLEAMSSGLPVVATNVGGNLELVEEGTTGFLFAPGESEGLAEKLCLFGLSRDLVIQFGKKGRAAAEERFSLARMVAEYENLYRSIGEER